jgi:hypothetical protein
MPWTYRMPNLEFMSRNSEAGDSQTEGEEEREPHTESESESDADDELEDLKEHIIRLRAEEAEHEAKARNARDHLHQTKEHNEAMPLLSGDKCWRWTLRSSAYLDAAVKACEENDNNPIQLDDRDQFDIYDFREWKPGELRIGKQYLDGEFKSHKDEIGAEFELHCKPGNEMLFRLMEPDFAALEPLRISVWDMDAEAAYDIDLTFLAHDLLELRMPGRVLPRGFRLKGDMVFVGIQRETAEELEEQFEEDVDDEYGYY